jgi:probable F420-dependent oxidoreductase
MKVGVMPTPWETPTDLVRVAQLAEARGIESIWFGEHSHLPIPTTHAFSADTPEFYRRVPDPYIVLAAIAAATNTIRLGTGISLPAEHNPLTLAKALATLDQTSGGRFEWGIGYGWNRLEMVNRGLNPRNRMARLREVVMAVRQLWTQDVAGYTGDHVSFTDSWSWPKPVQAPHPPILLGCRAGDRAFGQLVEFCDGWLPSVAQTLSGIDDTLPRLRRMWAGAGRDPDALRLTFMDTGFWKDVTVDKFRDRLRIAPSLLLRLQDLGADRVIVGMPLFRTGDIEPMLDAVADLVLQVAQ